MADPITWYTMGKAVDDPTTIDEEIDAAILTHNMDPSAHGQENESLYEHRAAELLDHLSYSIYNIKTNPAARVYKAIVGSGLEADFDTVQAAIDWTNLYGGGTVYVKAGTYNIDSDLTLYSNVSLLGEGRELTILDFQSNEHRIVIKGTSGKHIQNVEFANLTIQNLGQADWFGISMLYADDCKFEDIKFYNITSLLINDVIAIYMDHCQRSIIENCYFDTCDQGFYAYYGSFHKVEFNYFTNISGLLFSAFESPSVIFRHNNCQSNGTVGNDTLIYFGTGADNLVIDSNLFESCKCTAIWSESGAKISITNNVFTKTGNTYDAISVIGCSRSIFANNRIVGFTNNGISLQDNTDYCVVVGNVIYGCGQYGVKISSADCNKNLVVANSLIGNSSGPTSDAGTSSLIANNVS